MGGDWACPRKYIVIRDCRMKNGHGGVTVGSEISGGVRNVFAENCQMDSPHLDIAVRIKNNAMRGGLIEGIFARNIDVGEVAHGCILRRLLLRRGRSRKVRPRCPQSGSSQSEDAKGAVRFVSSWFQPCPGIDGVRVVDCEFNGVSKPDAIENVAGLELRNVKENGKLVERGQTTSRSGSPS